MTIDNLDFSRYQLGWSDDQIPVFKPKKGINEAIVREMSGIKNEEPWMLDFRLNALKRFEKKPMLPWFADRMPDLDFNDIYYYIKPTENQVERWEDLPDAIKNTYERLGIPEAERKYLAGVTAQYESEVVFHRNREDLERLGVLFCDMDTAVREYPDLVRKYFGTVIPPERQQVRRAQLGRVEWWFVHLRAAGRQRRPAPAGLLPHQHREHGSVRAHADHRRRGSARSTTSKAARRRSTRPTRCTRRSSSSSRCPGRASPTRPSRTGRTTSTTSSPSARAPKPRRTSSGSTATSVRD